MLLIIGITIIIYHRIDYNVFLDSKRQGLIHVLDLHCLSLELSLLFTTKYITMFFFLIKETRTLYY